MMPAPPGILAFFKSTSIPDRQRTERVVAFDDDGFAYIVGRDGLERADIDRGHCNQEFLGLEDLGNAPYAILPGNGWLTRTEADGATYDEPVVGWRVDQDGYGRPLTTDSNGDVAPLSVSEDCLVFHPHSTLAPPTEGLSRVS